MPILTAAPESGNLISCEEMCQRYYASVRRRVHFLVYHSPVLYNREELVEDLVQETFYKAVRAYPRLRHEANINAWLWQIATNLVRDYLRQYRKRNYKEHIPIEALVSLSSTQSDPEALHALLDRTGPAFLAWHALPPKHQTVLYPLICGHTRSELADVLGYSQQELYWALRLAREAFKRRYKVACKEVA